MQKRDHSLTLFRLSLGPARGETSAAPSPSSSPAARPRPRTRHNPRPPPSRCARCRGSPSTSCGEICASAYGTTHSPSGRREGRVSVCMQRDSRWHGGGMSGDSDAYCLFPCSGAPSRDTPYARPAPARKAHCGSPRASRPERGPRWEARWTAADDDGGGARRDRVQS